MEQLSDKNFLSYIEKKVRKTIRQYSLFSTKDRIAVAASGGKDSTACLYILKKLGYDVEAITIDASIGNYTKQNLANIHEVCAKHCIKLHTLSFRGEFGRSLCYIRGVLKERGIDYSSCMLCGVLKRYLLNKHCRKEGYSALATGHNLDDEAEAFLMNVFRNDIVLARRQGPASQDSDAKFIRRVKPMYFITNEETRRYCMIMGFPVNYGICPCSTDAHRRKYRKMLLEFERDNPGVKYSIVRFQEEMKGQMREIPRQNASYCSKCGEPSSGKVCKACHIFESI